MKAVSVKNSGFSGDNRVVEVVIVADTTPNPLPTTGADVSGLDANCVFAPFSVLYIVNSAATKLYIADESGHFIAQ